MKKILLLTILALGLAAAVAYFIRTQPGKPTQSITDSYVIDDDTAHLEASLQIPGFTSERVKLKALKWVNDALGGHYLGDVTDVHTLLAHYALQLKHDYVAFFRSEGEVIPLGMAGIIKVQSLAGETGYVTLLVSIETNSTAYIGRDGFEGASFDANTGEIITWERFLTPEAAATDPGYIAAGLRRFFDVETDDAVRALLLDSTQWPVPYPRTPPLLTPDGIRFQYDTNEIDFSPVPPSFTVTWTEMKPSLSKLGILMGGR